jgi:antitoxin ParD1/3/4
MKSWVEEQVKTGKYCNSSDYVRDLVRKDQAGGSAKQTLPLSRLRICKRSVRALGGRDFEEARRELMWLRFAEAARKDLKSMYKRRAQQFGIAQAERYRTRFLDVL